MDWGSNLIGIDKFSEKSLSIYVPLLSYNIKFKFLNSISVVQKLIPIMNDFFLLV